MRPGLSGQRRNGSDEEVRGSQHESVGLATTTPPTFPALGSNHSVDVAAVGGGVTGLTTALLLQRHGARVAVVEADPVGAGTTGGTTGKVTSQHSLTSGRLSARSVEHLAAGDGDVVDVDGRTAGAFRHPDDAIEAISATCTYMGCTIDWNGAETSWDCTCHGSGFVTDGAILNGPAIEPLEPIDVDSER